MTRKEALTELLEKVKAGEWTETGDSDDMWLKWHDAMSPREWKRYNELSKASFYGSMDAALSLFEAVLPGWGGCVWTGGAGDWAATVSIAPLGKPRSQHSGKCTTPSCALLMAILEALVDKPND